MSEIPSSVQYGVNSDDPYGRTYSCSRNNLELGHISDDALADTVVAKARWFSHIGRFADERVTEMVTWCSAAKDRVKWLSRQLSKAERERDELFEIVKHLHEDGTIDQAEILNRIKPGSVE